MLGKFNFLIKSARDKLARRLAVPAITYSLERLGHNGFQPVNIIDVGAYRGDFARDCFTVWPDTHLTCFEPQPHMREQLLMLERVYAGKVVVHDCLLGANIQEAVALFQAETASSVLQEYNCEHPAIMRPMRTLDSFRNDFEFGPCDLLKLDVQGYELEVLKGSQEILNDVKVILAEVNLLDIHKGVPLLPDFVQWLYDRDFVPYDICGITRRPLDSACWQIDMLFVPLDSSLRADKRWNVDA